MRGETGVGSVELRTGEAFDETRKFEFLGLRGGVEVGSALVLAIG